MGIWICFLVKLIQDHIGQSATTLGQVARFSGVQTRICIRFGNTPWGPGLKDCDEFVLVFRILRWSLISLQD